MIEPYRAAHRPAVVDLLERVLLPEDAAEAGVIVDLLSADGTGLVATDGDTVIGVATASTGHADPAVAHLDLIAVDPAHRRRRVASGLLADLERRLAGTGHTSVRVAGNAPDYVWPGVDVRYTPALCTLAKAGYRHDQTAWNMTADLTPGSAALIETRSAEQRLAGQGVVVRRATDADLTALLPVVRREWGAGWAVEVERAVTGRPDGGTGGCHLAERDGEPVAFAAWGGCRPSWFGPMGTRPNAAGLGIGAVLLRRCLADQAAIGLRQAQIGWVGPIPFYSGVADARVERVFFLYRKTLAHS